MGTLKTIQELETETDVSGSRGNTGEHLQNLIESLASVYGVMFCNDSAEPQTLTGVWENLTIWDTSRDTRGVQDDLVEGWYTIKAGGGGRWTARPRVSISVDTAGTYKIRPRIIYADLSQAGFGGNTVIEKDLGAGETWVCEILGLAAAAVVLDTGDHIAAQIDGPNGAVISPVGFSYFEVDRK